MAALDRRHGVGLIADRGAELVDHAELGRKGAIERVLRSDDLINAALLRLHVGRDLGKRFGDEQIRLLAFHKHVQGRLVLLGDALEEVAQEFG